MVFRFNELTPYAVTSRYDLMSVDLLGHLEADEAVVKTLHWAKEELSLI
jgi:hypothetical protein